MKVKRREKTTVLQLTLHIKIYSEWGWKQVGQGQRPEEFTNKKERNDKLSFFTIIKSFFSKVFLQLEQYLESP